MGRGGGRVRSDGRKARFPQPGSVALAHSLVRDSAGDSGAPPCNSFNNYRPRKLSVPPQDPTSAIRIDFYPIYMIAAALLASPPRHLPPLL